MSRFYAGQSSSDSEDSSSSDNENNFITQSRQPRPAMFLPSDDEEEVRHVVRSAKEKCWEALQSIIKLIQNACKIDDMSKLVDHFDNLTKTHTKHKNVIQKEGTPQFYIKCLLETNDYVDTLWSDTDKRKKMSKLNSKSFNNLKRKLKKYMQDFTDEIQKFKDNPEEEVVEEDEQEEEEDDEPSKPAAPMVADFLAEEKVTTVKAADDGDESDSSYWDSSSDDMSESEDEAGKPRQLTAEFFLKTDKDKAGDKSKRKPRTAAPKDSKKKKDEKWEEVRSGKAKTTLFEKGVDVTHAVAIKKLNEIILNRGRRSTVRQEQVELLKELRDICEANDLGMAIKVRITLDMCLSYFDYNTKVLDCMKPEPWEDVLALIETVLNMLIENDHIKVSALHPREEDNVADADAGFKINANPVVLVETLHREFVKILQNSDAHSTEYMTHLRQEARIINIIKRLKVYVETVDKGVQNICSTYLLLIEYIYYKYDYKAVARKEGKEDAQSDEDFVDSTEVMKELCEYIYTKDTQDILRTRAILFHIYHHCLHDRWYEGRDLMLMSHLQENISYSDVPTQIIYNRTVVQLGLCAFRSGLMKEAHHALVDIQSTGRAKELLAQGLLLQRQGERISPEQEKKEKRRQIPFHMHINLELLECVYLVSAMLLEIPYVAAHEFDARRRMISKQFHHQLRVSERQSLLGPPDNMREHVVAASKKLKMGDYRNCFNLVINDKMKSKVWNLFHKKDEVIDMLINKIKEASLCTYLFTYSQFYDNLSLKVLSERFDLDKDACHRVISKLIINEELAASWDEPSSMLVLHKTDPTRLQNMVNQLSEKISTMVDMNERILETRVGGGYQGFRQDGNSRNYRGQEGNNRNYRNDGNYQNRSGYQGNRSGGYRQGNFNRNRNNYRDNQRNHNSGGGGGGGYRNNYYKQRN